jgi:hypothetical protein
MAFGPMDFPDFANLVEKSKTGRVYVPILQKNRVLRGTINRLRKYMRDNGGIPIAAHNDAQRILEDAVNEDYGFPIYVAIRLMTSTEAMSGGGRDTSNYTLLIFAKMNMTSKQKVILHEDEKLNEIVRTDTEFKLFKCKYEETHCSMEAMIKAENLVRHNGHKSSQIVKLGFTDKYVTNKGLPCINFPDFDQMLNAYSFQSRKSVKT